MKAVAVHPGKPNTMHLTEVDEPRVVERDRVLHRATVTEHSEYETMPA